MFGKNRTAPVPAHGKYSLSIKADKVVKGPDKWFEHGGLITDKTTADLTKQPHVRIEFDDIADTPKVFIDGVDVTDWKRNGKALVALHLDWITDDEQPQPKSFKLKTIEQNGYHIFNCKYNTTGR